MLYLSGRYRYAAVVLCFLLAGILPGAADVRIDTIKVSKVGSDFNIRLRVANLGSQAIEGPIRAELFIRAKGEKEWRPLNIWTDFPSLPPGSRVSHDFSVSENADPALLDGFFLKALVHPPGEKEVEGQHCVAPGTWGGE